MVKFLSSLCVTLLLAAHAPDLHAQEGNVLGLPAVPQGPPSAPTKTGSAANKSASSSKLAEEDIKAMLSGQISLASFYQVDLITVRVVTSKTFVGALLRAQALQAAKLVQRDVRLACGKLCKPAPMPAPELRADNKLSFDIVVSDYVGTMSTADMVNLVSGKRISAATQPAPAKPASPASQPVK